MFYGVTPDLRAVEPRVSRQWHYCFYDTLGFPLQFLMDASSKAVVQVLLLALVVQVTLCQHWSYGWLPGGKRSVGELEATIRVGDRFNVELKSQETSWNERVK